MKPTAINSFALPVSKTTFSTMGPVSSFNAVKSVYPSGLSASAVQGPSFGNVMTNLVSNLNETVAKPDEMMRESILHGTYDIHDVMLANAKADLAVNLTAQFTTKVVQAYDRILQIQV